MTIWRKRIACWIPKVYKHTLRISNTYCVSTVTMVARTRLFVKLYAHCLYCCNLLLPFTLFTIKFLFCIPCTTFSFFCTFNEWYSTHKLLLLLSLWGIHGRQWHRYCLSPRNLVIPCYLPFLPLSIPLIHIHSATVREKVSDPTTDSNYYTHSISSYLKH